MNELDPWAGASTRAQASAVASAAAERFVRLVARVRSWALRLAVAAAVAAAVIVYAIVRDGFPSGGEGVLAVIGIAAVIAPPLVLAGLAFALGELVGMPERLARLPENGRAHGEELRRLVDDARAARGRRFHVPRMLWRTTRLTSSARETLTPYAPLLPFLSVPFLVAIALASVAAVLELIIAAVLAIMLLVD